MPTPGHVAYVLDGAGFVGDAARLAGDGTLLPMPTIWDADPVQAAASHGSPSSG